MGSLDWQVKARLARGEGVKNYRQVRNVPFTFRTFLLFKPRILWSRFPAATTARGDLGHTHTDTQAVILVLAGLMEDETERVTWWKNGKCNRM